jgi:organic hydroperoxide reductase OsmC/OhrA
VANCLAASLTFCLQRNGAPGAVSADATVEIVRNERNRLRVGRIAVKLRPSAAIDRGVLAKCLTQFEDFCVVTESVRRGLDVVVEVETPSEVPMAAKTEESS